jgi:hypothetical protein
MVVTLAPTWLARGCFAVNGVNLVTAANLAARSYSITETATQGSSSLTAPFTAATLGTGTGPVAFSSFMTADFTSVMNYRPGGLSGQQIISPYGWGYMSSSWMDHSGQSNDYWNNSTLTTAFGKINPALCLLKAPGSPNYLWNADLSVNGAHFAGLMNNFYKTDPLGVAGVMLLPYWDGTSSPTGRLSNNDYGTMLANMASYMLNFTMGNGKKFPLIGMCGQDEPGDNEATCAAYYNAAIPKLKAVNSKLMMFGPILSSPGMKDFGTQVPGLEGYGCNCFSNLHGNANSMDALNMSAGHVTDWNTATGANVKYSGFTSGGSDWDCIGGQLKSYPEAFLHCKALFNGLNTAKQQYIGCFWGGLDDCGLMDYNGVIYPIGYWYAQGIRKLTGPRWQVPTNSSGMLTLAVTPGPGRCSLLVYNVGNGAKSGPVALSHWPVNTTGVATATVWQMTTAQNGPGKDGTSSTVSVGGTTPGVTASMNFPDPSITIISI